MSDSKPHRNLPEENTEALEIAHGLVEQRYPSVPSYEMKLAYALLSLEEQLEASRKDASRLRGLIDAGLGREQALQEQLEKLKKERR